MNAHGMVGGTTGPSLTVTGQGRAMSQGGLRRMIPDPGRATGILKCVHADGLRHTTASELWAEEIGIGVLRRQFGHESLLTPIECLDHLEPWLAVECITARV